MDDNELKERRIWRNKCHDARMELRFIKQPERFNYHLLSIEQLLKIKLESEKTIKEYALKYPEDFALRYPNDPNPN